MDFTVSFSPEGEGDLARAWLAAADRTAVTVAAHLLERALRADPFAVGESRTSDSDRLAFHLPLGFNFFVGVDDASVFVTGVWLIE